MSIKGNSKELIAIAQEIAEKKNLDIRGLVEANNKEELNKIWKEAVEIFDMKNKTSEI